MREMLTIVTSEPSRAILAAPKCTRCSGSSGTSPLRFQDVISLKIMTGSSLRTADLIRPFASAGVPGARTFRPGMAMNSPCGRSVCWAAV